MTGSKAPRDLARDDGPAQRAFVGLLVRPLTTVVTDPELHRDLRRHAPRVDELARRLGYRVLRLGRAVRLVRPSLAGTVAAPPPPSDAPTRRVLALVCLLAAACEEATTTTTLAQLSGVVTSLTGEGGRTTAYDQGQGLDRRLLLKAADLLVGWGVLVRLGSSEEQLERWTSSGAGAGQVYDVDRDALLLLTSPDLPPAQEDEDSRASTRGVRGLRELVETPAVCYADLETEDAAVLRTTRGLRATEATLVTGGHVEARAEGLVLLLPEEPPSPATVVWPQANTVSWVGLLALDAAVQRGETRRDAHGRVELRPGEVEEVFGDLLQQHGPAMDQNLRRRPAKLRELVERQLVSLALLRTTADRGWVVSPVAARYRRPVVGTGD